MNKDKKIKFILIFIGALLIIFSFVFDKLSYLRIVINVLGLISLSVATIYKNKKRYILFPLYLVLYIGLSLFLDSAIVMSFRRLPIFSYSSITFGNDKVYNAIGYRVWDCDGKSLKIDKLYKMGYYCDTSNMDVVESNVFFSNVIKNYNDYKGNYIKIIGKISQREGVNYVEMQPYQYSNNNITINGYVSFSSDVTLKIMFKTETKELANYDVYDTITIVGVIKDIKEENGKYTILMDDSKIVDEQKLGDYKIVFTKSKQCDIENKLLYKAEEYDFYSRCLDNVIVKYDEDNIYELSSVLSSGKLKLDDILSNSINTELSPDDGSQLYTFDGYNIIKCSELTGGDVIIGDNDLSLFEGYCGINIHEDEEIE